MKLLRILTGVHAGAQLQLAPGTHRIGADDDADIQLSDWRGTSALLHVDATGVVSAQRESGASVSEESARDDAEVEAVKAASEAPPETVLLVDFVPMQFDEIVLCVGAADAAWPSDLDLLSMLLTRPAEAKFAAARRKQRRYMGAVAAVFVLGLVVAAASLVTTTQMSRAAAPDNAGERAQRVNAALASAQVRGLTARALGNTVVVSGMVATSADDDAVRALLDRVAPGGLSRNYDVAQNDARSIEDSLGIAGAHVRYDGDGNFAVTGTVASKADLSAALERVRADLDSNVKHIAVDVAESGGFGSNASSTASYSEMISSDDVRYAQTPDGVKHIYAVDVPDASAADAAVTPASSATATASEPTSTQAARPQTSSVDVATASRSAEHVAQQVTPGAPQYVALPDPSTLPGAATSAQAH
ncbi:HrpD5 family protein [Paraburkholderia tropica]|uniref:Type III secretion protein D n=1 Tax=Paraburkholderia tropica TaxID=92647 RepID=A0ABX5MRR5_9BURK|nr:HrpD5 family protein [Paraburkholderia tropica]MDE1144619.1 HrpD5 family protein [Paraburkholderia tropica]PXX17509.1 type III secretion protein D [Paraburkholderia tropica]PZW84691.1 type III secretion protein D [Paraburkholderia tropica]